MADEETIIELMKEIRPILEKVAHNRQLISYGELASKVGSKVGIPGLIPRDTRLHRALDEVSIDSFRRDGYLLGVLVVNKRSQRPGPGFFGLAKKDSGKRDSNLLIGQTSTTKGYSTTP